ncbi:MAG: TonB-dependent receptor [Gammaproteobacteria bacterium]|nr:TonB-dependent receptor [Gammaproteobacteria bacterium]MYD81405.1 TonB-dependent receptor [Gammaproteobacteria bacterium]
MKLLNCTEHTVFNSALVVLAWLFFAPALADENEGLEEVIVTAQKVEQNAQDVPISVSVIAGSFIEEAGANNISDLNGMTPNVIFQSMAFVPNSANISTRGIGFFDTDPFADQKTQVLIDGIPHARITGLGHDQIDIERIEVLRGPQGTLFGRNSLAGTVNIITRDAGSDAGVTARVALGEYGLGKFVLSADSGQMMNDSVRARLTISQRQYDGHVTNAFNGNQLGSQDSNSLRLKIGHSLTNVETTLTYYQVDEEMYGIPKSNLVQDPLGRLDGDVHLIDLDVDGFNNSKEAGLTLLSDIDLEAGTISIAANSHDSDFLLYTDLDGRAGTYPPAPGRNPNLRVNIGFDIDHSQESLEIRFHEAYSDRWEYVVGVFAFWEKSLRLFYQNIGPPFSATLEFEDSVLTTIAKQDTDSFAAFAQTDFHVNERISLVAGARLTNDTKSANVGNYGLPPPAPQRPPIILENTTTWDQPTWKLGAKYESSDSLMWYVTVSTGYKAGGFTSRATVAENVGPYDAEYVRNHEAGVKANLFGNQVRLSGAVFTADYEELVGWVRRTNSTGRGTEPIHENLGDVSFSGLELDSTWLITSSLNLDFSIGMLGAAWEDFTVDLNNDGIATDNSHLDIFMAPKVTAYGAISYSTELGRNTVEYSLDARFQSRYNTSGESNEEIYYRPTTTLFNGSITFVWGTNGSISLFGRNLSDKSAPRINQRTSIFPVAIYEPPRTLGLELRLSY